jgi:hypothetical protein
VVVVEWIFSGFESSFDTSVSAVVELGLLLVLGFF